MSSKRFETGIGLERFKEQQLQLAVRDLQVAVIRVANSASGVTPFRASKFLNVLGKVLRQHQYELEIFLGNQSVEEYIKAQGELLSTATFPMLKLLFEEDLNVKEIQT